MKIVLAIVTSLDGKSTKGNLSPSVWTSKEDQSHFFSLIEKNNLIIMGKNTYLLRKTNLNLSKGKLRVVLTRNPNHFAPDQVPGQLEFTNTPLKKLIQELKDRGYQKMLLVSGASLNSQFFKLGLIDELYLTMEPKIFGLGKGLVDETMLNINLKLISLRRLTKNGTLLLKYAVI